MSVIPSSAGETGWVGEVGTNYWVPDSDYVAYVLVFHYMSIAKVNPFMPSPSHSATDSQFFRFTVKNFSRSSC